MIWASTDQDEQAMHDMTGHFGMDDDLTHQPSSEQHGNYSNNVWGGIPPNSYSSPQQTSPIYEYQNYHMMNHGLPHSLPEQSTFTRMPPPPAHQQTLLPLLPAPAWMNNTPAMSSFPSTMPSMLTNPGGHPTRPVRMAPNSARMRASKPSSQPGGGRKCLRDDEKRHMCQIHMDFPNMKQAEIGAVFNVERSTVSKVLRQKEKFLSLEEPSVSPAKLPKGRAQDINLALHSWWHNEWKRGILRNREEIREEAIKFSSILNNQEGLQKAHDDQWLDEFVRNHNASTKKEKQHNASIKKQKHSGRMKLSRRSSATNMADIPIYGQGSAGSSIANTPSGHSPGSPYDFASPLSGVKDEDDYAPFSSSGYRHSNSRSTTSLSSNFTDTTVGSSFSGDGSSPATPFPYSPETTQGPFAPPQYAGSIAPLDPQRLLSQTFPILAIDADTATTATFPHHSTSPTSLDGSSDPIAITPSTTASTASTSPTPDDARLALETLLSYMEVAAPQGLVDEAEYQTVVKLTERMRQHSLGSIRGDIEPGNMECRMGVGV
ncbi:hypothetical protein VC83_05439 [Pseudogymnoascus destructans]|uniref:HTH CENPB-type domain-containing protein n=2 Tax=Pseudogymnoascus destructans TaxID=655981 RepID=L8G835_PSED2|nr:uncharacterized protein VC83_05439 [Pseudogymnoascus destructans]ELR09252.1 hypothetical protein GMDG_03822 [Pseudogymnoascus destructans 20631-21]OAF58153.1 hypothetical protein VC83_05439 [Pseudogymnoascus destructans]